MLGNSKNQTYSRSGADTVIGAGARVEGNIAFKGVLYIEGDVLGDVSCVVDSSATVVVGKTGIVTGTIKAPRIIVSGRVYGPVHSSESIEIQRSACVVGDAFYKVIDIRAGGVLEGLLTPTVAMDVDRLRQEHPIQVSKPLAVEEGDIQLADAVPTGHNLGGRLGGRYKLAGGIALVIVVVTLALVNRAPTHTAPPVADVAPTTDSSTKAALAVQSSSREGGGLPDESRAAVVSVAPSLSADKQGVVQTSNSSLPKVDPEKVLVVQGFNPAKPAGFFLVVSKEPSVLFKKSRQDAADGTHIDVPKGATARIAIVENEIFRVAKGRDIAIYYQGRKVASKIIESGAWMSFVPQPPSGEGDRG